ncbi:cell wall-binding repeat-containing protein [Rossellomorea vietnamensis]|nr:cell wall-binding repeat-containing protein [Rossellomorea vietnamensis]
MKKWITSLTASLLLASSSLMITPASAETSNTINSLKELRSEGKISLQGYNSEGEYIEEEPNNTFAQGNSINLDEIVAGHFGKNDTDIFKIDIEKDSFIMLAGGRYGEEPLSGQFSMKLYSSDETFIPAEETDVEGGDIYASYQLSPGSYYIVTKDDKNLGKNEKYGFVALDFSYEPYVHRIEGTNRYETALNIAYEGWSESGANEIILTTGTNFPDALAGAPLAYYKDAPILLTAKDKLHTTVEEAIIDLEVSKVTILGGTNAVSDTVVKRLKALGVKNIERIAGTDRYSTALAIAGKLPASDTAVIVNGKNYPDALSIASYAAQYGYPILLSDKDAIGSSTLNKAKTYGSNIVIGGEQAISGKVYKQLKTPSRISGQNRYETSVNVAKDLEMYGGFAFVATGTHFADALTGSVLAAYYGEPLVLTTPDNLHVNTRSLFETSPMGFTILGGTSAVSPKVEDQLGALVYE